MLRTRTVTRPRTKMWTNRMLLESTTLFLRKGCASSSIISRSSLFLWLTLSEKERLMTR